MRNLWRRLGLDAREAQVFLWSAATLFSAGWGFVSLKNVAETLFVKRVGVEAMPVGFLVSSILLVASTYAVAFLAARANPLRLLTYALAVLVVAVLALWGLVRTELEWAFWVPLLASKQIESVALITFFVAMGSLLHGRQAKRLYAPLMAGATLGTILGSFASEPLGARFGIPLLLPLSAVTLGLAALFTLPLRRLLPARIDPHVGGPRPTAPAVGAESEWSAFRGVWRRSWLFQALVASAFLGGVLSPMLYFQFSYVADRATTGAGAEQQLLALYAQFRGWLHFAVLAVQLGGASGLFRRLGIPLAMALSPLLTLIGFAGLSLRFSLPVGIFALSTTKVQDNAVYDPGQRVLLSLFPGTERARVTAWVEGPVKRLAGALGNLITLVALALGSAVFVGYVGIPLAFGWLVIAIVLWRAYPALLLQVSRRRDASADADALAEMLQGATPRMLTAQLVDPDLERCRAAIALLGEARRPAAVSALARAARGAPPRNRSLLVDAMAHLLQEGLEKSESFRRAARDVAVLLEHADELEPRDRAHLIQAYGGLAGLLGATTEAVTWMRQALTDPAPGVRLAAAAALRRAGEPEVPGPELLEELAAAIRGENVLARHVACGELRSLLLGHPAEPTEGSASPGTGFEQELALLCEALGGDGARLEAARALADVAAQHGAWVAAAGPSILSLRSDPNPRVRAAGLRFVGHAGLRDEASWLVDRVESPDPEEAAAAREGLLALGPAILDVLFVQLSFGRRGTRDALIPIVRELSVARENLRDLIDRELRALGTLTLALAALSSADTADIVLQRLRERIDEGVHSALLLLSALHDEDRIAELGSMLRRNHDPRETAVLVEALDAFLAPSESARLVPLVEDRPLSVRAQHAAEALGRSIPSPERAIREALEDPDELTRALLAATHAMNEDPAHPAFPEPSMLKDVEMVLHLRSVSLFQRLTTRQLMELAGVVKQESHDTGAVLVREGEFGDDFYLLVDGRVSITTGDVTLREIGPGEFFGEMAVLDGARRSATCTAIEPVDLLRIERHDLLRLMEELPAIAIAISQTLSQYVRALDERLRV